MTQPVAAQAVDVLLADGTVASIRPLLPSDREAVVALHDAASDENLRRRFFTVSRTAGRTYAEHLCAEAGGSSGVIALAAFVADELVAVASAEPVAAGTAEVAFMVADRRARARPRDPPDRAPRGRWPRARCQVLRRRGALRQLSDAPRLPGLWVRRRAHDRGRRAEPAPGHRRDRACWAAADQRECHVRGALTPAPPLSAQRGGGRGAS